MQDPAGDGGIYRGIEMNANSPTAVAEAFPLNVTPPHEPAKEQGYVVLDDDALVILMKFSVKNLSDVPNGVMLRATGNRDNIHAKDAMELSKKHLAERGRYRKGRVDSGEMVLHVPSAKESIASLRGAGYQLVDLHYYRNVKTEKYVIQLVFSRQIAKGDGLKFGDIGEAQASAIRALEEKAWELWAWDNRAVGNPITLNFTGGHGTRRGCKNPASNTKKLRIKDGVMRTYDE
ncbi:MAG: hypothetical protein WC835_02440 [Candidatus Paceibacterota bacterium]